MRKKLILKTISIVELKPGSFNEFMLNGEDAGEHAKGLAAAIASKEYGLVDGKPDKIDAEVEITRNEDDKRVFTVNFYTYK